MSFKHIKNSLETGSKLLSEFILEDKNLKDIGDIGKICINSYKKGGKILICGNGGSMTDAMHFAEELTGRFRDNRKALPAIALSDPSHITCIANDFGFDEIFARGVEAFGKYGDVFIGLSTSGNSQNIIQAFNTAYENGLKTVMLLGKDGGKLKGAADKEIIICGKTSDRIQELHMLILHILVEEIERELFPENYST